MLNDARLIDLAIMYENELRLPVFGIAEAKLHIDTLKAYVGALVEGGEYSRDQLRGWFQVVFNCIFDKSLEFNDKESTRDRMELDGSDEGRQRSDWGERMSAVKKRRM